MSTVARAGLVFLLLSVAAINARALDREAFTFTRYDLKLNVDPATGMLACNGKIQLRNYSSTSQKNVVLQISSTLRWTSIRQGETDLPFLAQTYTSDIDHTGALMEAIVTLPTPVAPNGVVLLEVAYQGSVPKDATRLTRIGTPEQLALASDWDEVSEKFTTVRSVGFVTWIPVAIPSASLSEGNSVLEALATWKERHATTSVHVALTTRQPAAPAPQLSVRFNSTAIGSCAGVGGATCASATYQGFTAIPTFAVAAYEQLERQAISVSFLPARTSVARDYAAAAERVQVWVSEWFGEPRAKVQVIQLEDEQATPYETGSFLFTPLQPLDGNAVELTMTHQSVHASFNSPRLWISEGLAHFIQVLVRERQAGRRAALQFLSQSLAPLAQVEKQVSADVASKGQPLVNTQDPLYYRVKAAYVWFMLRDMLGEEVLRTALQAYRRELDRQPAYIQSLLEKPSTAGAPPRSLEWFFDDWVYRDRGLPDFKIESAYPRKTLDGAYVVTATVTNTGRSGAEVPVSVSSGTGDRVGRVLVPAGAKGVGRVQFPETPREVVVNDGSVPEVDTTNNSFSLPPAK